MNAREIVNGDDIVICATATSVFEVDTTAPSPIVNCSPSFATTYAMDANRLCVEPPKGAEPVGRMFLRPINEATGRLFLRPTSPDDRSPVTGEGPRPVPEWRKTPPLYGFTDLDFGRVDGPLCEGETPPSSRDPIYPGVLLDFDPAEPDRGPTLYMGNNTRGPRNRSFDGCGIGLYIQTWDGSCYRGHWDGSSIVAQGNGPFRICPKPKP